MFYYVFDKKELAHNKLSLLKVHYGKISPLDVSGLLTRQMRVFFTLNSGA